MHRPSQQIERELNELKRKLQMADPLPSITVLEANVQKWTSRTVLDAIHRPDLYQATKDLEAGQAVWTQRAKDNTAIKLLENELNEAIAQERMERIRQANDHLNRAINEYQAACLIAARALRTLLTVQKQTSHVPGAGSNLSNLRLDKFNVPHMIPMSWQGTLGESMQSGPMPWEQNTSAGAPHLKVA